MSALTDSKDESAMARLAGDLGLDYDSKKPSIKSYKYGKPPRRKLLNLGITECRPRRTKGYYADESKPLWVRMLVL